MNLASIPATQPFLDTLAEHWLARDADPSRGLILLPTRRSARALAEAFLRAGNGRPMLLPRISALGALDETPLALAGALDLPPAVPATQRLAALTRLILQWPPVGGGEMALDAAWRLAVELAGLMDEAEREELDLAEALGKAAAGEHADHWQTTLQFLEIVTRHWPDWLAAQGLLNPAARQTLLLDAQARHWAAHPPADPVWCAGMTGGTRAVGRLLRSVAHLPTGAVVLPGLDTDMSDAAWDAMAASHPQAGLARLLTNFGAQRDDVGLFAGRDAAPPARARLLSRALLPAQALSAWRTPAVLDISGISRLAASDQQQEAAAIALVLRNALETPGATAALVTPDRSLAGRVSAELLRWGIVADDSAGEALSETPPAVFLRLLAAAVEADLAPVALLALLKHPLAGLGLALPDARAAARGLELSSLRGPRPQGGILGLRQVSGEATAVVQDALGRLERCLEPALRQKASQLERPDIRLAALIEAAELLAATDETEGPARLWALEEGEALAAMLAEALPVLANLPDQPPRVLPGLLDALLEGQTVRSRRAVRGRDKAVEHPRIHIWGLLEARLQSADTIVLGGLVEGAWPPATDPGPWMSRQMRKLAGLPDPEEAVGQAAHDFVGAACAAPNIVFSSSNRRDNAPVVAARWLTRIDAMLAGQNARLAVHPAASWAGQLDVPIAVRPVAAPRPTPAVVLRPRKLSVTEIETWLADPYAIYARHVLRLRPLDPLEQSTDASDYGSLVHDGMNRFLAGIGTSWPADALAQLQASMDVALEKAQLRRALSEWWRPRLARIVGWVVEQEILRRDARRLSALASELRGEWVLPVGPGFTLRGRADRIERFADDTISILDYKTGQPPSQKSVEAGLAPQLLLEAAMAGAGAFGAAWQGSAAELVYWHLSGGAEPGVVRALFKSDAASIAEAVANAEQKLRALIHDFDAPDRPYLAQPHPGRVPRFPVYAQLARVDEWRAVEEAE